MLCKGLNIAPACKKERFPTSSRAPPATSTMPLYTLLYMHELGSSGPRHGLWGIPDYSLQSSVPSGDWPWALALGSVVRPQL